MGFFVQRSRRYATYFWACLLSCVFVLSSILPASAQTSVTWEDLQTQSIQLHNPYEHLTTAQTYRLSNLYQLREWVTTNQPEPDSYERAELQRLEESFVAEGIDADELLKEADVAREYWAAKARSTNADIIGSSISLDGYMLPLGVRSTASNGLAQNRHKQTVTEFLLVPYVGACIHVPAPPPNQMVYVESAQAIETPGMFSPVKIEGKLQAYEGSYELFQVDGSRTVDVSYKMELDAIAATTPQAIVSKQTGGSLLTLEGWKQLPATIANTLTTALSQIQSQESPQAMFFALALSFSYGVLHTLGPGHGKAVIVSYFVGQGGSLQRGLVMGGQIAIFHVLSATLLVIFTDTVVRQLGGGTGSNYRVVQLISYGAIALLGGWMLRQTLTSKAKPQTKLAPAGSPSPTPEEVLYPSLSQQILAADRAATVQLTAQPAVQTAYRPATANSAIATLEEQGDWVSCSCLSCSEANSMSSWLALAVGAVPCSGALLVLLYGLANDMLWQSVAMVLAISAGMAITLSWIGLMAILAHRWGVQAAQQRQNKKGHLALPIPLAQLGRAIGASCVCLLGLMLFAATWIAGA